MLIVSEKWKKIYPGSLIGTLVMQGITNALHHPVLEHKKRKVEDWVRQNASAWGLAVENVLPFTDLHGDCFGNHRFRLSREFLLLKNKPLIYLTLLKEIILVLELQNRIMTTGHDWDCLTGAVRLEIARGAETYRLTNDTKKKLKPGEMILRDNQGIIFSSLYGPDLRTRMTLETGRVFWAAFAPPGTSLLAVYRHLQELQHWVRIVSPRAETQALNVYYTEASPQGADPSVEISESNGFPADNHPFEIHL